MWLTFVVVAIGAIITTGVIKVIRESYWGNQTPVTQHDRVIRQADRKIQRIESDGLDEMLEFARQVMNQQQEWNE